MWCLPGPPTEAQGVHAEMIHPRYHDAFCSLATDEVDAVVTALMPHHPSLEDAPDLDGPTLLQFCQAHRISQADVLMSMCSTSTPSAITATERLLMKPIDRRTATEMWEIERAARPIVATIHPREVLVDTRVVRILATSCPKRAGSKSADLWRLYQDGQTVTAYLARGGTRAALQWDQERGFISIVEEASPSG